MGSMDQAKDRIQQDVCHRPVYLCNDGIHHIYCHRDLVPGAKLGIFLVLIAVAGYVR